MLYLAQTPLKWYSCWCCSIFCVSVLSKSGTNFRPFTFRQRWQSDCVLSIFDALGAIFFILGSLVIFLLGYDLSSLKIIQMIVNVIACCLLRQHFLNSCPKWFFWQKKSKQIWRTNKSLQSKIWFLLNAEKICVATIFNWIFKIWLKKNRMSNKSLAPSKRKKKSDVMLCQTKATSLGLTNGKQTSGCLDSQKKNIFLCLTKTVRPKLV